MTRSTPPKFLSRHAKFAFLLNHIKAR